MKHYELLDEIDTTIVGLKSAKSDIKKNALKVANKMHDIIEKNINPAVDFEAKYYCIMSEFYYWLRNNIEDTLSDLNVLMKEVEKKLNEKEEK